ncbi:MAG: hypothetical protein AAB515_03540 [Patescibacteria group bacterium]
MDFFRKLLGKSKPENDFSDFFRNASSAEKKKLFKRVIRKASEDQRALIKKYDQLNSKTAS